MLMYIYKNFQIVTQVDQDFKQKGILLSSKKLLLLRGWTRLHMIPFTCSNMNLLRDFGNKA